MQQQRQQEGRKHGYGSEVGVLQEASEQTTVMHGFRLTFCPRIHSRWSKDLNIKIRPQKQPKKHEFMTTQKF